MTLRLARKLIRRGAPVRLTTDREAVRRWRRHRRRWFRANPVPVAESPVFVPREPSPTQMVTVR